MKVEYCTASDGGCRSKQRKVQIHRRLQYCTTPGKLNRSSALCATDSLWQKGQILFSPDTSREHIFLNVCLQRFCFSDVENTRDCTDRVFTRYQPKGILGVPARLMFSYFRDKTDRLLTDLTSGVRLLVFLNYWKKVWNKVEKWYLQPFQQNLTLPPLKFYINSLLLLKVRSAPWS